MSTIRTTLSVLVLLAAGFGLLSCATVKPEDIPADLSPAKYFQKVQELVDNEQYADAQVWLAEFQLRFATTTDPIIADRLIEGEYLEAHILFKQDKLPEARARFASLVARYDGLPEDAANPPRWILVLSRKRIEAIDAKIGAPAATPAPTPAASPAPAAPAATPAAPADSSAAPAQP